jgi:Zn-dependent metalloprotease
MRTKVLLTTIFSVTAFLCSAQNIEKKTIIQKDKKGTIQSVEFSNEDKDIRIPASAEVFFKDILQIQTKDKFEKIPHKSKRKEFIHEHFEQYYNGVRVEGGGYNFHYKNREMFFAHGNYIKIDNIDTNPVITVNEAKESFTNYKNIPSKLVADYSAELIIREIPLKDDTIPTLVFKVYLTADHPNNTEIGFVDAQTGKVLMTEPVFIDYSAIGTFATRYSGVQSGVTQYYNDAYHLADSTSGRAVIHTWNLNGNTNISNGIELSDNDNNWTQSEHASNNNNMALDVHWTLQQIRNRLFVMHGINSFNDDGFPISAYVKYGNNYDNAFWDPATSVRSLFFGVGDIIFNPLASLDVVAHEFGHGITQFQIGWGASGLPRAFNEGMSDIWGVIMEHCIYPNEVWQIGEQIMKNYTCLRNLQNTNDNGALTKIADTYGSTQYNNSTEPYVWSGVFSHWFYLLAIGGSGTNGIGNNYTVTGIGMNNAENLIVESVFNNYLRNTTSYSAIRTVMINVASNLYGANSSEVIAVTNAWYAVGVGTQYTLPTIFGPSAVPCTGTVTYTSNVSGTWTVSDNLQIINGQGTNAITVQRASGASNSNASVSINGMLTKNIYIGLHTLTAINGPGIAGNGVFYFSANPILPVTENSYEWFVVPTTGVTITQHAHGFLRATFTQTGTFYVLCRSISLCTDIKSSVLYKILEVTQSDLLPLNLNIIQ